MVTFFSPVSRGTAPASSWRARLLARTTNSNLFSLGVLSTPVFPFKSSNDAFRHRTPRLHAAALSQHDGAQPIDRGLELIVDDDVVVLLEFADLLGRDLESTPNLLFAVLAAAAQPLFEDGR